jgi:hypothetical protein
LIKDTRDWTLRDGDPSLNAWVRDITVDPAEFEALLKQKLRVDRYEWIRPGPKSDQPKIRRAFEELRTEGREFRSWKEARHAVLERLVKVGNSPKEYSMDTFRKATRDLSLK